MTSLISSGKKEGGMKSRPWESHDVTGFTQRTGEKGEGKCLWPEGSETGKHVFIIQPVVKQ